MSSCFNAPASIIFSIRNADKFQHGDVGRGPVAGLQLINGIAKGINHYDNKFTRSAKSAVSVFEQASKNSKVLDYAGKAVKWGCKYVNPLLCVSGAIKVLRSDDKVNTAISETTALAAMFAGEGIFKASNKGIEALLKTNNLGGKFGSIIKGLLFVCTSVGSYSLGQKLGKSFTTKKLGRENINQKA